jgi:3-polyprenyl-4-hydroxybenzoate decarboxylase
VILAYDGLRDWVETLERAGELKRVKAELSPELEMAELADRAVKSNGPALLFENVAGYKGARVLMNQFGSERRMRMALGVDSLDDVAKRIEALLHPVPPTSLMDKLKMLPMLAEVGSYFPKIAARRRCRRVEVSCADDMARRWWSVHHAAVRRDEGPAQRQAQRRDVSHASVRRQDHRHALAASEGCCRALARSSSRRSFRWGHRR